MEKVFILTSAATVFVADPRLYPTVRTVLGGRYMDIGVQRKRARQGDVRVRNN